MNSPAEDLRAAVQSLDNDRKAQLVARLRHETEVRRTSWTCPIFQCTGAPHPAMPTPHARRDQRLPFQIGDGLLGALWMAGRGYGKTRVGAEGVRQRVDKKQSVRVALIGRTTADVRDVMVEGESGLLSVYPRWQRPLYEPSKRRLTFHNGAIASTYSSDEPDLLRGPQHDLIWGDEVSTWKKLDDVLNNAFLGLRLGDDPRAILTGTPRPTKAMKRLVANPKIRVVRGSTYDNLKNLAAVFHEVILGQYEGTRVGRQELLGELLEDVEGALLSWSDFEYDGFRPAIDALPSEIATVTVNVDPAVTSNTKSDHTGISVTATDADRRYGYVLWSERYKGTPAQAMGRVAALYDEYQAAKVIAEVNNGGDYVQTVLHQLRPDVPFQSVRASHGKTARAEPVTALYEQHRIFHIGHPSVHAALEDEYTSWTMGSGDSPDVMESVVWGLTNNMLSAAEQPLGAVQRVRQ